MNWKIFSFRKENKNQQKYARFVEEEPIVESPIPPAETYDLDELATRKGLEVYKKMRLDDQVRACSDLKKSLILSSGYKIEGTDNYQVDFINRCISNLPKSFSKKIKNILTAFDYGFSITEIVLTKQDKLIFLKDLKTHSPFSSDFEFDEYGNIKAVKIAGMSYSPQRFIIYSFADEFDNPYGNSDLKSAYSAYFFKQIVWRFWASHLEGFGSPLKVGKIPASASRTEKEAFEKLLKYIHFRTALILPRSESTKEEFGIELLESKREGGSQFKDAILNADERIARALLFPRLFGLTGEKFGSYALGKSQFEVVYSLLSDLQKEIADEITTQLIHKLLRYNFVQPDLSIKLVFLPPNREFVKDLIEIYISLVKEGLIEKKDSDIEKIKQFIRL